MGCRSRRSLTEFKCLLVGLGTLVISSVAFDPAAAAEEFAIVGGMPFPRQAVPDARAAGMGNAFTAVAMDASATAWNVGALPLLPRQIPVAYSSLEWLGALDIEAINVTGGIGPLGLGLHLIRLNYSVKGRTIFRPQGIDLGDFDEYGAVLGAGIDVAPYLSFPEQLRWGVGLGLDYYDLDFIGTKTSAWDMDFGTLLHWSAIESRPPTGSTGYGLDARAGYAVQNLWNSTFDAELLPGLETGRADRLGASLLGWLGRPDGIQYARAIISIDRSNVLVTDRNSGTYLGGELTGLGVFSFSRGLAWRSGERFHSWGVGVGIEPGHLFERFGAQFRYADQESLVPLESEHYTFSFTTSI